MIWYDDIDDVKVIRQGIGERSRRGRGGRGLRLVAVVDHDVRAIHPPMVRIPTF